MHNPESILAFWFGTETDDRIVAQQKGRMWWAKNEATDQEIARRFADDVAAAADGKRKAWAATPSGLLALILLTDQFPRNIYRGQAQSFAYDALALSWSLDGLARGMERKLRPIQRVFLYLPLEHAESIMYQARSVQLFEQLWLDAPEPLKESFAGFLNFAVRHRDIIARFGRFPHRNAILGRASTPEEITFLQTPGSSF
ncbi:MAG TPA: DUF924 family protein [Oxalicibacterium sp.]|jgi:uncharacterized protein (DUF924 family)|nr:DUF924 family protein [Oxalicibacterium sp.]